jgi:4-hydroxybenzoate polyprenyltransferase
MWAYVEIARVDHWFKNVFIIPGVIFALLADRAVLGSQLVISLVITAVAVCLAASSNYVINEVLDAPFDKLHPEKQLRPVPSGQINPTTARLLWVLLGISSLALGFTVSVYLGLSLLALLVAGLFYNLPPIRTKDLPYVDVLSEAVNNPIRMLIGWYGTGCTLIPPISLLVCYWALGAFLMGVKRLAEYRHLDNPQLAAEYRPSFKHYNEPRLLVSLMCYATACGMLAGIFIARYHLELVLTVPPFAVFMALYLRIGLKPNSPAQNPERLLRRRSMIFSGIALTAIVCFSLWLDSPRLRALFTPTITPQTLEAPRLEP